jgi:hypothetical protein
MPEVVPNPPVNPAVPGGDFFVTGGTLRPDAPSYIERQADKELCHGLLGGEFCYVLTSRQMGKSSLMVRTVQSLKQEGVAVAVLDLTAIGQNVTLEQWYDGLMSRLGQQLDLEDELLSFWEAHPEWGPLQRFLTALERVVLERRTGKVVIFVDEIDIVRSLPFSTDEFFAAIRECHNRRSREPAFGRLAFGLLGVAAPSDLIRDTRMTPFNIGRRIELNDFTGREAAPLARGLGADPHAAQDLLARVLYWTGGHPYLTQRLCRALADSVYQPSATDTSMGMPVPPVLPTVRTVDTLAQRLFLSRQARDRDDNLIFVRERLLRSEVDVAGLLFLYRKIHSGQVVPDDETNPLISILRLSGITRGTDGYLRVRNRIYAEVFDQSWIQINMPQAEVRRQRKAGRRGMLVGFGIAAVLLLGFLFLGPAVKRYREARLAYYTVQEMEPAYRKLHAYRDTFETTMELGLGGTMVPLHGSGSLIFERSNKVDLAIKSPLHHPELEVRLWSDGESGWASAPSLGLYQRLDEPPEPTPFDLPPPAADQLGACRVMPVYRLLLAPPVPGRFQKSTRNLKFVARSEINGEPVVVVSWEHDPEALLESIHLDNPTSVRGRIPVTAWVNSTNHLVVQMQMDLSPWAQALAGRTREVRVTGLRLIESHRAIETADVARPAAEAFNFTPPPGARQVPQLELPAPNFSTLSSGRRQLFQSITPRIPQTPRSLVDLSEYYNAALSQTWHFGMASNSLDALPPGLLQLGGTMFDVRGIVQLSGRELDRNVAQQPAANRQHYPQQIAGIRVNQHCRQLHFLHAAGWRSRDGARIGSYVVHYADGQEQVIPIIYGEDVRDWNEAFDPSTQLKRSSIVWQVTNRAGLPIRLFKTTWVNPMPETEIVSIDYLSAMSDAAPFVIAITAER